MTYFKQKSWAFAYCMGLFSGTLLASNPTAGPMALGEKEARLPANYVSLTAHDKLNALWKRIDTPYATLPKLLSADFGFLGSNLARSVLAPAFDVTSDEMPAGRKKIIHRSGVAAIIEYRPVEDHGLTGIFQSGAIGVVRFSLATDSNRSFTPGAAFKFLVDGKPSVNIQVMNSLDGQGKDHNFFAHTFANKIKEPTGVLAIIGHFFNKVKSPATHLSTVPLASVTWDGQQVQSPKVPAGDVIYFQPTEQVKNAIPSNSKNDFRADLAAKVPKNTILYYVMVDTAAGKKIVGEIHTRSTMIASAYEDQNLLFQHHR